MKLNFLKVSKNSIPKQSPISYRDLVIELLGGDECGICGTKSGFIRLIHHKKGNGIEHRRQCGGRTKKYWLSIIFDPELQENYMVVCQPCHRTLHCLAKKCGEFHV